MRELEIDFRDQKLDGFLYRWMTSGLTDAELREWSLVLLYNREFREEFCDFLKAFRDKAWIRGEQ